MIIINTFMNIIVIIITFISSIIKIAGWKLSDSLGTIEDQQEQIEVLANIGSSKTSSAIG